MTTEYSVAADLEVRLAQARNAPTFEFELSTPWFDEHAGGLDRWRDEPADRSSDAWKAWKARDDARSAGRGPAPVIVRQGWQSDAFALLGFWAVEAVAAKYPRAHGNNAEPESVAAMADDLAAVGEVLVRHSIACGAPLAVALADAARTVRFGTAAARMVAA